MLADFNWAGLKKSLTYSPSDCMAHFRPAESTLAILDVFLKRISGVQAGPAMGAVGELAPSNLSVDFIVALRYASGRRS
jgi:hypothetical protein